MCYFSAQITPQLYMAIYSESAAGTTVCTNAAWRVQLTVCRAHWASTQRADAEICTLTRSGRTVVACGVDVCRPSPVPALDRSETVCSASVAPPTAHDHLGTLHKVQACLLLGRLGALGLCGHFRPPLLHFLLHASLILVARACFPCMCGHAVTPPFVASLAMM